MRHMDILSETYLKYLQNLMTLIEKKGKNQKINA
jgi:hypothetical protein